MTTNDPQPFQLTESDFRTAIQEVLRAVASSESLRAQFTTHQIQLLNLLETAEQFFQLAGTDFPSALRRFAGLEPSEADRQLAVIDRLKNGSPVGVN